MTDSISDGDGHGPTRRAVLAGGAAALGGALGFAGIGTAQGTITGLIPTPQEFEDENLSGFVLDLDVDETVTAGAGGDGDAAGDGTDGDGADDDGTGGGGEGTDDAGDGQAGGTEADGATGTDGATDSAGTAAAETPACGFDDWPPDEIASYDATLIDRKEGSEDGESAPREESMLHVSADAEVDEEGQYLINEHRTCESDFVGVELEPIEGDGAGGDGGPAVDVEDNEARNVSGGDGDAGAGGAAGQDVGTTSDEGPGFGAVGALAGAAGLGGLLARRWNE